MLNTQQVQFNDRTTARDFRRLLLGCAVLLTACGAAKAPSQSKQGNQAQAAPRYAIAGISPGMTALQVADAAAKAGYRLTNESKGNDWAEAMRQSVEGNRFDFNSPSRGIRGQDYRRGGESLSIVYIAMPVGSVATLVSYSAPLGVLDFTKAEAEITRRYGPKSFGNQAGAPWSMWCAKQATSARDCLNYARLTVGRSNESVTMSTDNPAIEAEQEKLLRKHSGAKASF